MTYYLTYAYSNGEVRRTMPDKEAPMRKQWLRLVQAHERDGYTYLQTSETTGCLFKTNSTINIELMEVV